jgi:hypothetical protein
MLSAGSEGNMVPQHLKKKENNYESNTGIKV